MSVVVVSWWKNLRNDSYYVQIFFKPFWLPAHTLILSSLKWLFVLYFFYRFNKLVKDVTKFIQSQEKGPWPQNKISALDRALGEAVRILDKKVRVVSSKIKLKDNKTSLANDFSYQSTMCEFYWRYRVLSGDLYEVCILTCCWSRVNHFKSFYSTSHISNKAIPQKALKILPEQHRCL